MSANSSRYQRDPDELVHTVEEWDSKDNFVRFIGRTMLADAGHAIFELAIAKWPRAHITLRHEARVDRDSRRLPIKLENS